MRKANRRLRLLVAVFAVVFFAAFARVAWLQAVKAQALDRLADNQHREELDVKARRGTIFDRLGVQLAFGEPAITVYANPKQITDPRETAIAVGEALELDPGKLYPLLTDRSRGFVYLARKADPEKVEALESQELATRGPRTTGSPASNSSWTASSPGRTARRRSCATRSGGRSTLSSQTRFRTAATST